MMLLLTMALFMSCGDDDEVKLPDTKDVNYANIAGTWRLSEWNGEKIDYVPANSRLLYSE